MKEIDSMKKVLAIIVAAMLLAGCCCAESAQSALERLLAGNAAYMDAVANPGDVSPAIRRDTAENGQHPYAVVVTCSDSRVPAEHIFSAGIGELFVIRTAGNVIGTFELGSVEYGAEHLHAPLIVVLGHTGCGAVDAALSGGAHGAIKAIIDEIAACLPAGCDARDAEIANVENSIARIRESEIITELGESGAVEIRGAIYDIASGAVRFLDLSDSL